MAINRDIHSRDVWYENRHLLREGQVFTTADGDKVRLKCPVPGDGTDWYVDDEVNGSWYCGDSIIHPLDLIERVQA